MKRKFLVTQSIAAAIFGMSLRRYQEYVARGIVPSFPPGKIDLEIAGPAIVGHLREIAAGRGSDNDDALDLVEQRARLAREQAAIVRAGVPAKMQVTFGEDPEAHKVLDTGKKRTPGDAAHIAGISDAVRKSAVAKIILEVEAGRVHNPAPVANDVVVKAINDRPRLAEAIHAGSRMYRTTRVAPAGLAAGMYFVDQLHASEAYEPFVEGVATGLGFEHRHDPRLTLRNTLIGKKFTTKNRSYVVAAYVVKAWNRYKSGKALQSLLWRSDEDFPLVR